MQQKKPQKMAILGIFGYINHTKLSSILLKLLMQLPLDEPRSQKIFKKIQKILVPENWPKMAKNLVVS